MDQNQTSPFKGLKLPLKTTKPIDITVNFTTYINSKHKNLSQKASILAGHLKSKRHIVVSSQIFEHANKDEVFNKKSIDNYFLPLQEYTSIINEAALCFSDYGVNIRSTDAKFQWMDYVSGKFSPVASFYYELVCLLFNCSMLLFNIGHYNLRIFKYDEALKYFKDSEGYIIFASEIMLCHFKYNLDGDLSKEMMSAFIAFIHSHSVLSLYLTNQNKFTPENCSMLALALKCLDDSWGFIDKKGYLKKLPGLSSYIAFLIQYCTYNYFNTRGKILEEIHSTDQKESRLDTNSFGRLVAFMEQGMKTLKGNQSKKGIYLKDDFDKKSTEKLIQEIEKNYNDKIIRNKEIYKQKTAFADEKIEFNLSPDRFKEIEASIKLNLLLELPKDLQSIFDLFDKTQLVQTQEKFKINIATTVKNYNDHMSKVQQEKKKIAVDLHLDVHAASMISNQPEAQISRNVQAKYDVLLDLIGPDGSKFVENATSVKQFSEKIISEINELLDDLKSERKICQESQKSEGDPNLDELKSLELKATKLKDIFDKKKIEFTKILAMVKDENIKKQFIGLSKGPEHLVANMPNQRLNQLQQFYESNPKESIELNQAQVEIEKNLISLSKKLNEFEKKFLEYNIKTMVAGRPVTQELCQQLLDSLIKSIETYKAAHLEPLKNTLTNLLNDLKEKVNAINKKLSPEQSMILINQSQLFAAQYNLYNVIVDIASSINKRKTQAEEEALGVLNLRYEVEEYLRMKEFRRDQDLEQNNFVYIQCFKK